MFPRVATTTQAPWGCLRAVGNKVRWTLLCIAMGWFGNMTPAWSQTEALNAAAPFTQDGETLAARQERMAANGQDGKAPRSVLPWALLIAAVVGAGLLALYRQNRRLRRKIEEGAPAVPQTHRGEAEQRFRTMVDVSPHAMLMIDTDGLINCATASAATLLGYAHKELLGQPVDLLVPVDHRVHHPQQRASYTASDQPPRQMGAGRDLFALRSDGQQIPVEVRISQLDFPEGQFVLVSMVDITDRHNAELKLRESEERFRDLFDNANDLIFVLDLSQEFVYVNAAWCRTLGYTPQQANAIPLMDVIAPESRAHAAALRTKSMHGENLEMVQLVLLTRNQERIEVEGNITQKIVDGKSVSSRGVFHDVSERNRQIAELAVAKQKAEAADYIKSAFLATMSHELRTPLNSIIGFTGILLKRLAGPLNEEQAFQMGKVRESAHHLLALVNDVLDISRIEAGELRVASEPVDLQAGIAKTMAAIQPLADAAALPLSAEIDPQLGMAMADARRVEQVMLNLLGNAVKFTKTGSVSLRAQVVNEQWLSVAITDTGIGISEAEMPILFQPFRQVDSRLARQHEGTGLGLAISRKLTELMGGRLEVRSESGKGSTFTLTLPRAPATTPLPP